jgi:4-hydroxy-3-polyprenylbenzoate decarboxylase
VVGIATAEGAVIAIRLLDVLRGLGVETHLVTTAEAEAVLGGQTDTLGRAEDLAHHVHQPSNQAARISSGSFPVDGMIVAPCDPFAAAAIAHGVGRDLLHRAADVTLKEGRPLALLVPAARLSPMAQDNLRKLESIRGVSVVRPLGVMSGAEASGPPDATIDALLRAVGIEREG